MEACQARRVSGIAAQGSEKIAIGNGGRILAASFCPGCFPSGPLILNAKSISCATWRGSVSLTALPYDNLIIPAASRH